LAVIEVFEFFQVYGRFWDEWRPDFVYATIVTLQITVGAYLLGIALGLLIAIGRIGRFRVIRGFCIAYVEVARGVPALVILFLLYFGLVPLGIVMDNVTAGIVGLGMSAAGYMAEIFRAGIAAIHKGQREAGLAVGMRPLAIYRYIILPQATRVALPPLLNMVVMVLRDSSLASLISAPEIMLRAKDLAMTYFLPMHLFLLAGAVYFCLALPVSLLTRQVERRMHSKLGARMT
jgi:His/Glu/Gln/Arg/opine family amino acid ABC transporter permease subunit